MVNKPGREVVVAGVGLHPFGRFPEKTIQELARPAIVEALEDSGVKYKDIQAAYFGHVYHEGMSLGEVTLRDLGLTGIPIVNVENACSSSSTGLWLAFWAVATGMFDVVLVFGAEKVPRGPVSVTAEGSPERLIGSDFMMAAYALGARRYMSEFGAPREAFAQVSVKAHRNAAINPYSHYKKVFTLEEVLNSRMIADPLTLYQCCPTSEGASAAVICAREVAPKFVKDMKRVVTVAGATLRTTKYASGQGETSQYMLSAKDAYEMAGLGPKDIDVVQVHDAATSGEIEQIEYMGLVERGKAWKLTLDGETETSGRLPVNTDGGLQGMGHPFGATGIRMIHELVTQLRGEAGVRQVKGAKVGLAECSGAGGVCTVFIVKK
jgi:acetyl-CoA acetyltransferase